MNRSIFEFDNYIVRGVKEFGDHANIVPDKDADYFTLYGVITGSDDRAGFLMAIGDYENRFDAEIVSDVLDNKKRSLSPQ